MTPSFLVLYHIGILFSGKFIFILAAECVLFNFGDCSFD